VKLVAGLGNPGRRYAPTRHNVGYMVADELAQRWELSLQTYDRDFEALVADGPIAGQRVLLVKPQTFMNLSGRSVLAVQQFYKLALADLLIICDDLDLPVGRIRLRASGTGGGQKGLENILLRLGTVDIPRLRIGIGSAPRPVATEYVLDGFATDERDVIAEAITTAADAVECWLKEGIDAAMNRFNPKRADQRRGATGRARDDAPEGESS
jgi:PTH1 family peptidyl-tRNA hydrolase